jgi:hypothetical protein
VFRTILSAIVISLSLFRAAWALDANASESASALMHQSGMWEQLGMAQGRIDQALSQLPANNKTADSLRAAARDAYSAERLRSRVAQELASNLDRRHVPALLRWYASTDGATITKIEVQGMDQGMQSAGAMQNARQAWQNASDKRRRHLGQLLVASRAVETTVEIATQELVAVRRGVATALGAAAQGPTEAETRRMVESQRPMFEKMYREGLQIMFALVYQQLPDDVLERYVAFLNSPAGKHFTDVGVRSMLRALGEAAEAMGRGLATQRS